MLFEHGLKLENTQNKHWVIYMMLYKENIVVHTDHFIGDFVYQPLWCC